ncbi:hypothetical protein M3Y94_00907100 [Aphelenchoides besseyi]|nr:hypothetical protein M3Y94_00907100 [Aphelenchoides besseyi]KAI6223304.1 Gamma-interferon-inducible lysosomal thiol reductase [Aphelenchoides besseyi]
MGLQLLTFVIVLIGAVYGLERSIATKNPIAEQVPVDCSHIPPQFWCMNSSITETCGVQKQCDNFLKESQGKKLNLTVLYEAQCPYCQKFITGDLNDTMYNLGLEPWVNVELVPYGNAVYHKENDTYSCQHGPTECQLNEFAQCAIKYLPSDPVPYLICLEKEYLDGKDPTTAPENCYRQLSIKPEVVKQIETCTNSETERKENQNAARKRTEEIWPDQRPFVPYILINNVSLNNVQNLIRGGIRPLLCHVLSQGNTWAPFAAIC